MPPAVVRVLPAGSATEKVPLGAIVTAPSVVAVVVSVNVEPEPVTVTTEPLVTVKSAAATVAASRASFEESVKRTDDPLVGSTCVAACSRVTVGATESKVTVRSVPPATVCALPAGSATANVSLRAIATAP